MTDLDDVRLRAVNEHLRLENAHDFDGCIGEFGRPAYEVVANGEHFDGAGRVADFLEENATAFPDFVFEPTRIEPATDVVLVEGRFKGTHLGPWRGLPPTGKAVDFAMCLVFEFEGEVMVKEKLYFDVGTPLRQMGVADDPNSTRGKVTAALTHPVAIVRALGFTARSRRRPRAR